MADGRTNTRMRYDGERSVPYQKDQFLSIFATMGILTRFLLSALHPARIENTGAICFFCELFALSVCVQGSSFTDTFQKDLQEMVMTGHTK